MDRDHLIRIARRLWTPLALMVLVVVVSEVVALGGSTLESTVITMLINLVIVVGLYAFSGVSGVFSFGQIGFMAIGAYTTAILSVSASQKDVIFPTMPAWLRHAHASPLASVLIGGLVAAGVAAVFAIPLSRLTGLIAGLGTFAFLLIINVVAGAWTSVTNGTSGMSTIPIVTTLTRALIFGLIAIAAAWLYQESRFGRRLRTSREDAVASRAIGVNVGFERGVAFVVSASIVGVAGGLYAEFLGSIDPTAFYLSTTFLTIAMLVVGGLKSLSGAVIGTLVISTAAEALRRIENGFHVGSVLIQARPGLQQVGLGVLMLAVLIWRPEGLTGGREVTFPKHRPFSRAGSQPVAATEQAPELVMDKPDA